jgi:hypothetical protein
LNFHFVHVLSGTASNAQYRRVVLVFLAVHVLLHDNTFSTFSSTFLFAFRAAFHAKYRFFSRSIGKATNVFGSFESFPACCNEILGFLGS